MVGKGGRRLAAMTLRSLLGVQKEGSKSAACKVSARAILVEARGRTVDEIVRR